MHPDGQGSSKDWIQLDQLAESIGEDPGRWLDGPLDPHPRIRGIRTIDVVRAWIGAERRIANIRGREPRKSILAALERREAYLRENGEFDPELAPRTIMLGITSENIDDVLGPKKPGATRIPPIDEPTWDEDRDRGNTTLVWDPETVRERYQQVLEDDHSEQPVAADGGERHDE